MKQSDKTGEEIKGILNGMKDKKNNKSVRENENENESESVNKTVNGKAEKVDTTKKKGVNKTVNETERGIVNINVNENYFNSVNNEEKKVSSFRLFKSQYKKIKWLANAYDMGVSEFMRKAVDLIIQIYTQKLNELNKK